MFICGVGYRRLEAWRFWGGGMEWREERASEDVSCGTIEMVDELVASYNCGGT